MCKNPQVDTDRPAVAELMADVAAAVARRAAAVSEDVYEVIIREIPELRDDKPVLALLASSVDSNVGTCLQIMQHRIGLTTVRAPAAAVEYARRLAQRGTSLTALLRAYRVGHACFSDWVLTELARQTDEAEMISATTLGMSRIVAGYIDQTSEEMVAAYTRERENWLRNRSAVRAARIRDLLSGERIDVSAAEAVLGYRLRQYHVGLVCWAGDATGAAGEITRLERAISQVAGQAGCHGEPVFLPRDESSAWAWLPLGIRDRFEGAPASTASVDADIHFAFGDAAKGTTGFRITHQQAVAAQAVTLAAGSPAPQTVTFSEVAPVAMMLGTPELLRAWVLGTLGGLATDDEHQARLRGTLLVFLHSGGSYKTTAEQLTLHKNTVQYRIRKAEESLGRPVSENRHDVELALRASHWLGSTVLRPAAASAAADHDHDSRPRVRLHDQCRAAHPVGGDGLRGIEQDLLERARQVTAPHEGGRRGQRMMLKADRHHVIGDSRPRQPGQRGPASGDELGAGQHRGGPVRGRGESEVHLQRVPQRRVAEFEARVHGPQDPRPAVVGSRLRAARPVDDVHAGQIAEADHPAARRRVPRSNPHVGFEFAEAHRIERGGQRPWAGRQPA
jgi:hypothetical protein